MKRITWKWILMAVILLCLSGLYVISSTDLILKEQEVPIYNISVIVNDESDACLANFKKGVKQTFSEWTADVNYVTLYDRNSEKQQTELLEREISNGADAVLLFPVDGEGVGAYLNANPPQIPIICMGSNIDSASVSACIHGDHARNGQLLAEQIAEDMGDGGQTVHLFGTQEKRSESLELSAALRETLAQEGIACDSFFYTDADSLNEQVKAIFREDRTACFVALDSYTQEAMIDGTTLVDNSQCRFYAVGATDRILSYIDKGKIDAAAVNYDFDMGYLGIRTAVQLLEGETVQRDITVKSLLVTPQTVYRKENQKILFPLE